MPAARAGVVDPEITMAARLCASRSMRRGCPMQRSRACGFRRENRAKPPRGFCQCSLAPRQNLIASSQMPDTSQITAEISSVL
jgi:hypothetical protein